MFHVEREAGTILSSTAAIGSVLVFSLCPRRLASQQQDATGFWRCPISCPFVRTPIRTEHQCSTWNLASKMLGCLNMPEPLNCLPPIPRLGNRLRCPEMRTGQTLSVSSAYSVQYSDPITVAAGAKQKVGREDPDFPGWKWCTAMAAKDGFPGNCFLALVAKLGFCKTTPRVNSNCAPGDNVVVEDERQSWLLVRNARGKRGWIPADRVRDRCNDRP